MPYEVHTLIQMLQDPALYPHDVEKFNVIETHISIILLTGEYAYKLKKPVNLGFLDFSTLEKRRFYCEQELRLNKRLAPQLYLEVIGITEGPDGLTFGDQGNPVEYAVKMREFPQDSQFDRLLADGKLTDRHIDDLARKIADFHQTTDVASMATPFGSPENLCAPVEENFAQILARTKDDNERQQLHRLQSWAQDEYQRRLADFTFRKQHGFIRECHGDLHLRNVALLDDEPLVFDCIEFSENLRWIDVISEVAFMVMDLDDRGQTGLASRFLNTYLEHTGDYEGLRILRYYLAYRAMVRAKVDCIRADQPDLDQAEKNRIRSEYRSYIDLAEKYTQSGEPALILMHGLSGSGKTTISQLLLEQLPAIRIRSDVERKRLFGLTPEARTESAIDVGIYSREAGEQTYARLETLAANLLECGVTVIVDAAFLKQPQRTMFHALAQRLEIPLVIIDCQAPDEELRTRLMARQQQIHEASDADIKVLENQLQTEEPLTKNETRQTTAIDTTNPDLYENLTEKIRHAIQQ